jgi:exodeoxyribonuclease VII small subunit
MSTTADSKATFKEAFDILQRNAETLRNQREPNIDDLLAIVTGSVAAYKLCTQRIDAVEAALKEALGTDSQG